MLHGPLLPLLTRLALPSAIARARGAGRLVDAESLAWDAMVIAAVFGALFRLGLYLGGPGLYRWLGGRIGWPLAATLFRFGCAAAATVWAMQGALDLDAVYGIVVFGTLGACVVTLWSFRQVQWGAGATSSSR